MSSPQATPQGIVANKRAARQERFAHEYVKDLNGTRAAIAADYAEKSARVARHRGQYV